MKTFVIALVCVGVGFYAGSYATQGVIAEKFSQGEGRAICEAWAAQR